MSSIRLDIYVPATRVGTKAMARGSAIVGGDYRGSVAYDSGTLVLDYEGPDGSLEHYSERLLKAVNRHVLRRPTQMRLVLAQSHMRKVGEVEATRRGTIKSVYVTDRPALRDWIGNLA